MAKLNFDSQRLPPLLIGYLIDSRVGEREIVATIISQVIEDRAFMLKKGGKYLIGRMKSKRSDHEFENIILECMPEKLTEASEAMAAVRKEKERIFRSFHSYLNRYYGKLIAGYSTDPLLIMDISVSVGGYDYGNVLNRAFRDWYILPKLKDPDKRALVELIEYLERYPVDPRNLSSGYLPYYIAAGEESFWMDEFRADRRQRHLVFNPVLPNPIPAFSMKDDSGLLRLDESMFRS